MKNKAKPLGRDGDEQFLTPVVKLSKDAIAAMIAGDRPVGTQIPKGIVGVSNNTSARILVDLYYRMQELRKVLANQALAAGSGADPSAEYESTSFMLDQIKTMEINARSWLEVYIEEHPMNPWFRAVHGIGPVLAACLAAHLGGRPVPPTVGHWWRFAGLDPSQQWLGKEDLTKLWNEQDGDPTMRTRILAHTIGRDPETVIRDAVTNHKTGEVTNLTKVKAIKSLARIPYNRPLKTSCWKVGDQFVKLGEREDAFYARFYRDRKAKEIARNLRGDRAELARKTLEKTPNHAQKDVYLKGMLPDGRVDLMARRATVKMFLSHLHELWFEVANGEKPPHPFATTIQGHAHYIEPPHREVLF